MRSNFVETIGLIVEQGGNDNKLLLNFESIFFDKFNNMFQNFDHYQESLSERGQEVIRNVELSSAFAMSGDGGDGAFEFANIFDIAVGNISESVVNLTSSYEFDPLNDIFLHNRQLSIGDVYGLL